MIQFRIVSMVVVISLALSSYPFSARAQEADASPDTKLHVAVPAGSVEKIIQRTRESVVVITVTGRDGSRATIGTGFVISADGLIATNLHVIGEARPITVEFSDGSKREVTEIHASERSLDLAVVRVKANDLKALELGDSDTLKQGQPVIAVGNPQGLQHSVVTGTVSATRELDGRKLIQLAIPIEPGNSGGPLLDLEGRAHGLLTMKSAITANLGFAVPSNSLRPLLEKPNPIPISRWLTIGALDPRDWTPLLGADWRQRAGRIQVSAPGSGFGGRTLCLSTKNVPDEPYEVAVTVKLDDEAGAAGLVFGADGEDTHYGFYPSNRRLRLTRFDGPDVFSWTVLEDIASAHYRPGDWNTLKVRRDNGGIACYVNGELVIESRDTELKGRSAGLASFRGTKAEFKRFQIGQELANTETSPAALAAIDRVLKESDRDQPAAQAKAISELQEYGSTATLTLRERAKKLERDAASLRELADQVHQNNVAAELANELSGGEEKTDLIQAVLLIARLDNEELDIAAYRALLDRMSDELRKRITEQSDENAKLTALNEYLFEENGFHGSRADYYNRSNSYFNEMLDDREGLPITLSILFMELGRRIGLNIVGVPLPGHFVVKHIPADGESQLIDVYENGAQLTREKAAERLTGTGIELQDAHLEPATKRTIVIRMLNNLLGVARSTGDGAAMLRYLSAILAIDPESVADRGFRSAVLAQLGRAEEAVADLDWIIEREPTGVDLDQVRKFRDSLERSKQ